MLFINKKWKIKELIFLLQQIEMYLSVGLPINKVLLIMEIDLNKKQKNIISKIRLNIESGGLLSTSLSKYINIPSAVISLIENGELTGDLKKTILVSIDLLKKNEDLTKQIINVLIYPIVIVLFTLLLTVGLLQGVVLQIVPLLKSLNTDLPFITKIVIYLSKFIKDYGLYLIVGSSLFIILVKVSFKKYLFIRNFLHILLIKTPFLGHLIYNYNLSIFFQSCGSLINSGVTIFEAYKKTQKTVNFFPLKIILQNNSKDIESGKPLSKIFTNKINPIFVASLINAGEISGSLGQSMINIGIILDKNIELIVKRVTIILEPLMMIFMGLIVGSIALSIIMPIYSISNSLQR